MRWDIHADGSFDIVSDHGSLRNALPGIDHQDVRCARIQVEPSRVVYELTAGSVELTFDTWEHGLKLGCTLRGMRQAPCWVHPIHSAKLDGFSGFFRQGIGFSGPSNLIDLKAESGPWSHESYLLAGLLAGGERTVVIGPHEHRSFMYKAQVHNRLFRANFRNREVAESIGFFEAGVRTERIPLSGTLKLPDLYVSQGDGLFDTLRSACGHIAASVGVSYQSRPRYHYCSAYHHGPNFTLPLLEHLLQGLAAADPKHHLQTVQIDDWYMTSHGDWLTFKEDLWPGGLRIAFEKIAAAGYTPGIWVAPFMVGSASCLASEHPDWLLKRADGSLVTEWRRYDGTSPDFEHYVLDTSHPQALAWVAEVFATMRSWGARFFKTDFLEWGFRDSATVARFTPGKTSSQYFDDAMRAIRAAIGPDSYWLGCITYFAPSIGYMDGMRMTSDVGPRWDAVGGVGNDGVGGGIPNMIEESFATLYMNHVFWQNDPDVVYVRNWHIFHSEEEFRSLAAWNGLLGHSLNTSDEIGDLPPERLAWWRWMRPQEEPWTARLPYFARRGSLRVAVRDYPQANGQAVLVLNDTIAPATAALPLGELTGQQSAAVFRWSPAGAEPLGTLGQLVLKLDVHHSALLFVSRDGKGPAPDLNLGGSRGDA
jgi:hypothetical protein